MTTCSLYRDEPLAVGAGALLLGPLRRRQQHVGQSRRLGRVVGVLHDDQLGLGQGAADLVQVGQADRGIGRRDPDRLEPPLFQGPEHLHGRQARLRGDRARGATPERLDLGAVPGVLGEPIARQGLRQQAGLAAAHRVRLAGQRERPRPRLADLAGQQVQVDEAVVLPHADGALVQPHAVEGQPGARPRDPIGQRADQAPPGRPTASTIPVQSACRRKSRYSSKPSVCASTKRLIDGPALEQEPADGVQQRDVAARGDRDVEVACSAVLVRRGSTTISSTPGFALRWALIRSKVTGKASAMLLPQTTRQSLRSMSS